MRFVRLTRAVCYCLPLNTYLWQCLDGVRSRDAVVGSCTTLKLYRKTLLVTHRDCSDLLTSLAKLCRTVPNNTQSVVFSVRAMRPLLTWPWRCTPAVG